MAKKEELDGAKIAGYGVFAVGVAAWAANKFLGWPFFTMVIVFGGLAAFVWKGEDLIKYIKEQVKKVKK